MVMKIFKTLDIRRPFIDFAQFVKTDVLYSVFLGLFVLGYAAGCLLKLWDNGVINVISGQIGNYIYLSMPTFDFVTIFLTALKSLGVVLLIVFCMGMFVPGQMLLTVLSLFEGVAAGAGVTYIFYEFGWSGVAVFGAIILPTLLIFLNFQFIMIRKAFVLSFSIFRSVFYGSDDAVYKKYKEFMVFFGIMIAVSAVCSLIVAAGYGLLGRVLV